MGIMLSLYLGFVIFTTCKASLYFDGSVLPTEDNEEVFLEKWRLIEQKLTEGINTAISKVLPILVRTSSEVNISDQCSADLLKLVLGLKRSEEWSWLMVDAAGKIPSGMLSGTSAEVGNFDQCIKITKYDQSDKEMEFRGRYCIVDVRFPLFKRTKFLAARIPMPPLEKFNTSNVVMKFVKKIHYNGYYIAFRGGVCVPSTCEREDVLSIANYVTAQAGVNSTVPRCDVQEELHFDELQITITAVIGVLVCLCIIGTVLEAVSRLISKNNFASQPKDRALLTKIVTCFSVTLNVHRLLHVDPKRDKQLSCIHGIRFLSMVWIILGHSYVFTNPQLTRSILNLEPEIESVSFQLILNALVAVDCFFFLSGFLLSYLSMDYVRTNGMESFNVPIILFRRVWRFFPSTIMTIAIAMMIPLIGSGPVWHETTDFLTHNCRQNWWTDLVFVNDFIHPKKMCLPHTWYSAADTQLFLVGIIYLLIYFKNEKFGWAFNVMLLSLSIVSTSAINYWRGFPPTLLGSYPNPENEKFGWAFNVMLLSLSIVSTSAINYWRGFPPTLLGSYPNPEDVMEFWHYIHCKPYVHLGVFSVGLALGTILVNHEKIRLSVPKVLLFWCMSIICNMSIMFSTYEWNRGNEPGPVLGTFYAGIHRVAWAMGLAWTVFACVSGYGGVINTILSWDGFVPLGRLTFSAYLWHFLIIVIYNGFWRSGIDAFHLFAVWVFVGNLVVTFCMAAISYVLYEAPSVQLERLIMSFISKTQKSDKSQTLEMHNKKNSMTDECDHLPNSETNVAHVIRL